MPVVYVPGDTRWGDLGKGIGQAAGGLLQAYEQQKVAAGVAEIWNDPNGGDTNNKLSKITKQYGWPGVKLADQLQQAQVKQQQLATDKAREQEAYANIGRTTVLNKLTQSQIPKTEAETQTELAKPAEIKARTEQEQAQTTTERAKPAEIAARTAAEEQRGTEAGAAAKKAEAETKLIQAKVDALPGLQNPSVIQGMLDSIPGLPPDTRQIALQAAAAEPDPLKKGEAANKVLQQWVQTKQTAKIQEQKTSDQTEQRTEADAARGLNLRNFAQGFAADPTNVGLLSGGSIKGVMEHSGIPTGDPQNIQMRLAALKNAAAQATSGGGFYSKDRFTTAKDVNPGQNESPLYALMSTDSAAAEKQVELAIRQKRHPDDTSIADALSYYNDVRKITGPENFNTYVANKLIDNPNPATAAQVPKVPNPRAKTVVMFGGNIVNPFTFKTELAADASFTSKAGAKANGSWIIQQAKTYGVDPQDFLKGFLNDSGR